MWKDDIKESVDMYNKWFMAFASKAFREIRVSTTKEVDLDPVKPTHLLPIYKTLFEHLAKTKVLQNRIF